MLVKSGRIDYLVTRVECKFHCNPSSFTRNNQWFLEYGTAREWLYYHISFEKWQKGIMFIWCISKLIFHKHHKYWITDDIKYQKEIIFDDVVLRKIQHMSKMIYQIQYLGWPDHGVPNDLNSFTNFILKCEELIKLVPGSIIVHCRYIHFFL